MFASPLVRVGTGPSWRSPAADDAVTLLFPKEGESLVAAPPRLFADPNVAVVAFHEADAREALPPVNPGTRCDWFSVGLNGFESNQRPRGRIPAVESPCCALLCWGRTHPRTYLRQRAITEYVRWVSEPDRFLVEEAVLRPGATSA